MVKKENVMIVFIYLRKVMVSEKVYNLFKRTRLQTDANNNSIGLGLWICIYININE